MKLLSGSRAANVVSSIGCLRWKNVEPSRAHKLKKQEDVEICWVSDPKTLSSRAGWGAEACVSCVPQTSSHPSATLIVKHHLARHLLATLSASGLPTHQDQASGMTTAKGSCFVHPPDICTATRH